ERRRLLFFLDRDLEGAEELLVERGHLQGRGLGLLHPEVEGRDLGALAAARAAEPDRGLQDERDLVALGLDAVQAVRDLRRLGERTLDGRPDLLDHPVDVFAARLFHLRLPVRNYGESAFALSRAASSWRGQRLC